MPDEEKKTYKDRIYGREWREWLDPEIPEYFNPIELLLDRHLGTAIEGKTALIIDTAKYTYKEVLDHVCRASHGLKELGLEAEDRLLLFGTDSLEFLAVWLGAIRCGVVPAVVSDMYKAENLLYFLRDTAAKACFIDEEQWGKLLQIKEQLPATLRHIIVRSSKLERNTYDFHPVRVSHFSDLVSDQPTHDQPLPRHENDITYMFYSGGTTGTAKGIVHLAHDFLLIPERHGAFWEYTVDDVIHATSKKYFTHGLWPGVLIPFYWGATSVISREAPTPENVISIIEQWRPTKLVTVPTIIKNILWHVEKTGQVPDFGSLEFVVTASEKMPPEVFESFHWHFGLELHDSIGSSEVTYEWIANRLKEFRRGSLGKPVFGFEIKLVDDDGNEVTEPHVEGEAWVKSRTACPFYWRKLDQTQETFIGPWARTGDVLTFDEDGFFWFAGRSNDVFKVKGLWVSPVEVEAALTEHPSVLEAAVIPYEDEDGLTKPKAFVVLQPKEKPSSELMSELKENVRRIGGYKVPEIIEFIESLPRTTLLKIDRRALREREQN